MNKAERHEEALERIAQWADAYPLEVFPEPDLKRVHEVLMAAGLSLDALSASAMRHAIEGVGKIAKDALRSPPDEPPLHIQAVLGPVSF